MQLTETEIEELRITRNQTRLSATKIAKRFNVVKKAFHSVEAEYDEKIRAYNKADRAYAMALHEEQKKKGKKSVSKPYDPKKRLEAKALKALEKLPKELREKIIADAQNGLF